MKKLLSGFSSLLLLLALPMQSFGATHNKEVTLGETTQVGNAELEPGIYKIVWNGTGTNVEVDFWKDRKVVASATATLVNGPSALDSAVQTREVSSGSAILEEIDFKNMQLKFSQGDQPAGN
jgi:hypothetical protein